MTVETMPRDRTEYQRAYYERTKEAKKAKRKKQPRTAATLAAEARYLDKRRLLEEIASMPVPTIDD